MSKKQFYSSQSTFIALSLIVLGSVITLLLTNSSGNSQVNIEEASTANTEEQIVVNIDEDDDPTMGDENAPILMVEFSDYQCPYCRKFYDETFPQIKENFIDTGLVKFAYRDLPLTSLGHNDATPAANAAECAREQEGDEAYFSYQDLIFEGQGSWASGTVSIPEEDLYSYAEELGLDMDAFTSCQENMDYYDEIQEDALVARSVDINGTPGFVINNTVITGAYPYETFETIFNQLLQ